MSFYSSEWIFRVRSFLQDAFYPLQSTSAAVWKSTVSFPAVLIDLRSKVEENHRLKEELAKLQALQQDRQELVLENERLRRALGFTSSGRLGRRLQAAKVLGRGPLPWYTTLEIDQGEKNGVSLNQPVIAREGLVGRVVERSAFSAKVLLLTDPASLLAAVAQNSRDFSLIEGAGFNRLEAKYLPVSAAVEVGDIFVTSAVSTFYPAGLLVGKVSRVKKNEADLFQQVTLRPAVDFSRLEEVFLVF